MSQAISPVIESLEQRRLLSGTYELQQQIHDPAPDPFGYVGASFASDNDNLIAIGRPDQVNGDGLVEIHDATSGALLKVLSAPQPTSQSLFGSSVAFVGDKIVVSAQAFDSFASPLEAVWVYEDINDTAPTMIVAPTYTVTQTDPDTGATVQAELQWRLFGTHGLQAVGDDLLVSALSTVDQFASHGAVFRYDLTASLSDPSGLVATQVAMYSPGVTSDRFGSSMAADGNTILIYGDNSDPDAAFDAGAVVYRIDASTNSITEIIQSPDSDNDHAFGLSMAVGNDAPIIAAAQYNKVYQFSSTGTQVYAGDPSTVFFYGTSVAVKDNLLFVSAGFEMRVDELGNALFDGAVYVYDHQTGAQIDHIDNPTPTNDPALFEEFGSKVMALSDGRIAVVDRADISLPGITGSVYVFGVPVASEPPTADAGGSYGGVRSQDIQLNGAGTEGSAPITAYEWDLNYDGTTFDVDATGATPTVSFGTAGTYTIALRVTDANGLTAVSTATVTIAAVAVQDGVLFIGGTGASDAIVVTNANGGINLTIDGTTTYYAVGGTVHILGGDGTDIIAVGASVKQTIIIDGGAGSDVIGGGGGDNVLIGGDGDDVLVGGGGRDLIIGGDGSDVILGGSADDILIAGSTSHDADAVALEQILGIWTNGDSYTNRVSTLRSFLLSESNLFSDDDIDVLGGSGGTDWFIADVDPDSGAAGDLILDQRKQEYADDIDLIANLA